MALSLEFLLVYRNKPSRVISLITSSILVLCVISLFGLAL